MLAAMESPGIRTIGLARLFGALTALLERFCSHVAIISQGRIVAAGSLEELRAGVASRLPGSEQRQRLTMEEIFLLILGEDGGQDSKLELSWLARTELA